MTDLNKIIGYYKKFDEWGRLDTFPGQLERQIVLEILETYIPLGAEIFDLGGGAGRYTYELARKGYQMHLADLSPDLINIAREKLANSPGSANVKSIEVANALNLSTTPDETFDHILLFGPLYHLTQAKEINQCLQEVHRILRPKGKLFAVYIPYHCGLISILDRSIYSPAQVDGATFSRVHTEGVFNNQLDSGFQEGHYLKTTFLLDQLQQIGFRTNLVRSIRGIGYYNSKELLALKETRPDYYKVVMDILHQTAADDPIVETCGHAMYIGEKI